MTIVFVGSLFFSAVRGDGVININIIVFSRRIFIGFFIVFVR